MAKLSVTLRPESSISDPRYMYPAKITVSLEDWEGPDDLGRLGDTRIRSIVHTAYQVVTQANDLLGESEAVLPEDFSYSLDMEPWLQSDQEGIVRRIKRFARSILTRFIVDSYMSDL